MDYSSCGYNAEGALACNRKQQQQSQCHQETMCGGGGGSGQQQEVVKDQKTFCPMSQQQVNNQVNTWNIVAFDSVSGSYAAWNPL